MGCHAATIALTFRQLQRLDGSGRCGSGPAKEAEERELACSGQQVESVSLFQYCKRRLKVRTRFSVEDVGSVGGRGERKGWTAR